jgi:tetratricopeptide (TPR) repeat protein
MKNTLLVLSMLLVCFASCAQSQDCPIGINTIPMYGHAKKCKQQLDYDAEFLANCDKLGSRKQTSAHMLMRGWQYFREGILDTAMMRFNQAWLLDSLNADIYWGFADLLGAQHQFKNSLPLFQRSLQLNPNNPQVWHDESISNGNIFFATKDEKYINAVIYDLRQAIHIDPKNAGYYGELTNAYSYFMQQDSARKYLKIADKMGSQTVAPQVRQMLTTK